MHKKIFVLVIIDQVTKLIFWSRDFFAGPLHLHPVKNMGLGFGVNFGLLPNLIIIAAALVYFIYYYFTQRGQFGILTHLSFTLVLAGAVSNIIDRLYLGYVRDFLDLGLGFTFNLADAMIVAGLILILFKPTRHEDYLGN